MTEYGFDAPASFRSGAVTFRFSNQGKESHDATLIEIPETLDTSLQEQLQSDRRIPVLPIARVKPRSPGQSGFFAVDLRPGRYGLVCFVRAPDGVAHAAKGMAKEFAVK